MKNRKKVLAALLAGVMTLSMGTTVFAAAEDGYALKATNTEAKSPDNDLVIAIEGSVSSMDPANIPDTNAISATRGCYEMLVAFDENQEIQGQLAAVSYTHLDVYKRQMNTLKKSAHPIIFWARCLENINMRRCLFRADAISEAVPLTSI